MKILRRENKQKHRYLVHTWSDKALKYTVVNRTLPSLHGGLLEITLTVPLIYRDNLAEAWLIIKPNKQTNIAASSLGFTQKLCYIYIYIRILTLALNLILGQRTIQEKRLSKRRRGELGRIFWETFLSKRSMLNAQLYYYNLHQINNIIINNRYIISETRNAQGDYLEKPQIQIISFHKTKN